MTASASLQEIEKAYTALGGTFVTPISGIMKRLGNIRAFVLDWDGVFNDGRKTSTEGSGFSEVDSMGLNLLRYAYFMRSGELPFTLIISGEKNQSAFHYCEREGLGYSFYKVAHKIRALEFLCAREKIYPSQVAYFFDDVLDVPIAEKCGIRIQVNQRVNPLFTEYCLRNRLADYLTASPGGRFAVREATELLIGLYGSYDSVLDGRVRNSASYQEYIARRRQVRTAYYTLQDGEVVQTERPA